MGDEITPLPFPLDNAVNSKTIYAFHIRDDTRVLTCALVCTRRFRSAQAGGGGGGPRFVFAIDRREEDSKK